MSDAERDALREKIIADNQKLHDSMGRFYLGKECPWNGFQECHGTKCSAFLLQTNEAGKIAGGACCIPLIASQVGPISDGLMQLASQIAQAQPRIMTNVPAGILK